MYLKKISLINYKNFSSKSLEFDEKINCFVGNNGVGKTNILDAIYYLSYTKGYFNSVASQNIKHGEEFFVIDGIFMKNNRDEIINCSLKKGLKKVIKRNGKEYKKLSQHIGLIPLVIISPADSNLIIEGSELRRKFMDGVISLNDINYLQTLLKYNKVLTQRNSLLKYFAANRTFDSLNVEIYDKELIKYGTELYIKRKSFINEFTPIFLNRYKHIIEGSNFKNFSEKVSLEYKTQLDKANFQELLTKTINKDRILQFTSVGAHKDDLSFKLNDYSVKKIGSQGQQKSFLIALKLAQFDFIKRHCKLKPLLLLDDIFDKLDDDRVGQLISLVNDANFGQIFISDTHVERTEQLIKKTKQSYKMFELK
jgi:DNA replication and repair protein RecF